MTSSAPPSALARPAYRPSLAGQALDTTATPVLEHHQRGPTPVLVEALTNCLRGYPSSEADFLVAGFTHGFKIPADAFNYDANVGNHPSVLGQADIVGNIIEREIKLGRVCGPFTSPPFDNFHVSPLALVPKQELGKYRLIHNLSYPRDNSVNSAIPKEHTSVSYDTLDSALEWVLSYGRGSLIAKVDIEEAYRIIPIHPESFHLLGFTWGNKWYFDRFLPFGLSYSCQLFERFSSAVQWILIEKYGVPAMTHILDDYMFFGPPRDDTCMISVNTFMHVAKVLNIPIKASKTVPPTTCAVLYGIEVDSVRMEARLPYDKLCKARDAVERIQHKGKVTMKELRSAIGFLAFTCKTVMPGRTFLRRLWDLTKGDAKPHHHIRLSKGAQLDLRAWAYFLQHHNGVTLLSDLRWVSSVRLCFLTDAAGNGGYSAVFGNKWICGEWPATWANLHITVLELYPICAALELWALELSNRCIVFWCDNEAVCHIINHRTSKDPNVMILMRKLIVTTMTHNIMFRTAHIPGHDNKLADSLSRFQFARARELAPDLEDESTVLPVHLLPENILEETF